MNSRKIWDIIETFAAVILTVIAAIVGIGGILLAYITLLFIGIGGPLLFIYILVFWIIIPAIPLIFKAVGWA